MKMKHRRQVALIAITVGLIALISLSGFILKGNAQSNSSTMRSLFESLDERMTNEQGFFVAITFANPLSPEDDKVWIIPQRREKVTDEISRVIQEIGDDHICFDVVAGSARYIECTPFSNIVSLRYFVE